MQSLKAARTIQAVLAVRWYHRPPKRDTTGVIGKFNNSVAYGYNRWFNPKNPDGSTSWYRLHELCALFALVNLTTYTIYRESTRYRDGEETLADRYWTKYGVDLGFRSVTREDS
jgi:hypothetical protein